MPEYQIFCDARFDDKALKLLRDGIAPSRLIVPQRQGGSVLSVAPSDSTIDQADIAFGQPDAKSVLKSERLRWLQITSAGFTRYDTPEFRAAAAARGLIVTNSSAVYEEACAEHVLAFMLAQARQLPRALKSRDSGGSTPWNELRNDSACLRDQEAVILGYGAIAARLVELLAPFQMKITVMRRQPRGDEGVPVVTSEKVGDALTTADHVIDIMPDNADSVRFVSRQRLGQMKQGAVFYNIGRGTTVDQEALAESLRARRLAAAWLDVTDPEPLPEGHPLLTLPNCFITPHTAGGHHNETETLIRHFLENFQRFVRHSPLRNRIM
ncbi:MAG: D-2-hydroxyacid dehydrogenase [Methylacidiphilales bacterium]|nr:D-2-hydroxyacid dehydrogenase [Candidatus Methylacidiphilales bacterium]